jgi:6-phosphogluconolactonase
MGNEFSRRELVKRGAALPLAISELAHGQAGNSWVLFGTDTGDGIYRARWNAETGAVGPIELAVKTPHPTFFAMHPARNILYTTNELEEGGVSAFHVDRATGALTLLGQSGTHGAGPCYISVDPAGTALFAANYNDGSLANLRLAADGKPGPVLTSTVYCTGGHGPYAGRQDGPHMHCALVSPDGHYLLACNLGCDEILTFRIMEKQPDDPTGFVLHVSSTGLREVGSVKTRPGVGPRHVAFHANGRWVYCIDELACALDVYDWHEGVLTPRLADSVSTLEQPVHRGADGLPETASEIAIVGDVLYAATRGADVIAVFAIDPATGRLAHEQTVPAGGRIPRHFAVSPDQRWIVVANQGTDVAGTASVAVFRRGQGGRLALTKSYPAVSPMFVQWV